MRSPFLFFVDDRLSSAELSAARLDGDLIELGEAYIPADAVETRELRAGSLHGLLGETLAATHLSAAWVHGALHDPPSRHTVQRAVPRRLPHVVGRRVLYRDRAVAQADLVRIGGVWVTVPVRTLADLARVADDEHTRAASLLADAAPGLAERATIWLRCHGTLPHKRAALALLAGLAATDRPGDAQLEVTRYTS